MAETEYIKKIDAVAAIQEAYCGDCAGATGVRCAACNMDGVITRIEELPAADPAEEYRRAMRMIYADFVGEAEKHSAKAENCSAKGSADFAKMHRKSAAYARSKADRVLFLCRMIGIDPVAGEIKK